MDTNTGCVGTCGSSWARTGAVDALGAVCSLNIFQGMCRRSNWRHERAASNPKLPNLKLPNRKTAPDWNLADAGKTERNVAYIGEGEAGARYEYE